MSWGKVLCVKGPGTDTSVGTRPLGWHCCIFRHRETTFLRHILAPVIWPTSCLFSLRFAWSFFVFMLLNDDWSLSLDRLTTASKQSYPPTSPTVYFSTSPPCLAVTMWQSFRNFTIQIIRQFTSCCMWKVGSERSSFTKLKWVIILSDGVFQSKNGYGGSFHLLEQTTPNLSLSPVRSEVRSH